MPNRARLLNPVIDEWVTAGSVVILESIACKAGVDWQRLLAEVRLDPDQTGDPDRRLPIQTVLALFEGFGSECKDENVLFDAFYRLPAGDAGSFDYVALFAPSIRQALENWRRFHPSRSNCIECHFEETSEEGLFTWHISGRFGPRNVFSTAAVAYLIGRLERMLGDGCPAPLWLEHPALPPKQMPAFLAPYARRVRFNSQVTRLRLPASVLDRQPVGSDPNLYRIVEGAAQRALSEAAGPQSPLSTVAVMISSTMKDGDCSIRAVAHRLGMSERSLQRTLEGAGTTFRKLLDDVRRHKAKTYLVETGLPVGEIAQQLGFSEISAFSRAVKQWYGVSPRTLRQNLPDSEPAARKSAGQR